MVVILLFANASRSQGPFWTHESHQGDKAMFASGGVSQFIVDCKYSSSLPLFPFSIFSFLLLLFAKHFVLILKDMHWERAAYS